MDVNESINQRTLRVAVIGVGVIGIGQKEIKLLSDCVYINGEKIDFDSDDAPAYYSKRVYGNGHSTIIYDFYDCVRQGKRFAIDGVEGAKAIRIVTAAYESKDREILLK